MNIQVFNGGLLGGWFLLTLGGILYRPDIGLMIAGMALIALTVFIALRFGLYDRAGDKAATGQQDAEKR